MSASDDKTVRLWDIPGETVVTTFAGHSDYVRTGLVSNDNPHLILTGKKEE